MVAAAKYRTERFFFKKKHVLHYSYLHICIKFFHFSDRKVIQNWRCSPSPSISLFFKGINYLDLAMERRWNKFGANRQASSFMAGCKRQDMYRLGIDVNMFIQCRLWISFLHLTAVVCFNHFQRWVAFVDGNFTCFRWWSSPNPINI